MASRPRARIAVRSTSAKRKSLPKKKRLLWRVQHWRASWSPARNAAYRYFWQSAAIPRYIRRLRDTEDTHGPVLWVRIESAEVTVGPWLPTRIGGAR